MANVTIVVVRRRWHNLKSLIRSKLVLRSAVLNRNKAMARWHGDVLDVGCGRGYNWKDIWYCLRKQRIVSYWGIDVDEELLEEFRGRVARIPKEYRVSIELGVHDIADFDPERMFDTVSLIFTYDHIRRIDRALERIRSILRDGGRLVLVEHLEEDYASRLWNSLFRLGDSLLNVGPPFKVADHLHFSQSSEVARKLEENGFIVQEACRLPRTWFIEATKAAPANHR